MANKKTAQQGVVAILTDEYIDYRKILIDRIAGVLQQAGYSAVCIAGGELSELLPGTGGAVCNNMYSLAAEVNFDGVICLSGGLIGTTDRLDLLNRALAGVNVPIVSLGLDAPGIASVTVDDLPAMHDLMSHLLTDTSCQHFAFLQGKQADQYSQQREQIFRSTLAEAGYEVRESR
ncbi:MAG: hypothetical protein AAF404_11660, partial [Pseudomonadota bacterium]